MGEACCNPDLAQEAFNAQLVAHLRVQDLQRDLAFVLEIVGQVDRRHPALAQLTLDGVAAFEGGVQAGDGIRHGRTPRSDRGQHPRAGR